MYQRAKRIADLTLASVGLIVLSPILALVGLLVWIDVGFPIFFVQERSGHLGEPFRLIKFRTMRDARDVTGALLPDGERLSRLGRLLRMTSLDEFPELLNVVRGEMSLVGPRPLLPEYDRLYSLEQSRRLQVRPGVTGLAQIRGRNLLSWEDKFKMDVEYVDNASIALDLRILVETIGVVFSRSGITEEGHATASAFTGTSAPARGERR